MYSGTGRQPGIPVRELLAVEANFGLPGPAQGRLRRHPFEFFELANRAFAAGLAEKTFVNQQFGVLC